MPSPLRVRQRLRRLLGRDATEARPAGTAPAAPASLPAAPAPAPRAAAPAPAPAPAAVVAPPAAAPTPEDGVSEEDRLVQEKAARHLARTRHGLLGFVVKQGGEIGLGALHDRSERRYFIGHKKFSDLMESMVADGQLLYDHSTGVAEITEAGRALADGPRP